MNCKDITEIEEFLRITDNLLHNQHYLCLIAKRYFIQLYPNDSVMQKKNETAINSTVYNSQDISSIWVENKKVYGTVCVLSRIKIYTKI